MHKRLIAVLSILAVLTAGMPAAAQSFPTYQFPTNVATLDREQLYKGTKLGQRQAQEISELTNALRDENDAISTALEAEELELTELRKTVTAQDFAPIAEKFDAKVRATRAEQDQKFAALRQKIAEYEADFWRQADPILRQMMAEFGVVFILDRAAIVAGDERGDITAEAISRIDTVLQ